MSLLPSPGAGKRKKLLAGFGALGIAALVTLGVFAANDWFPKTDVLTGKKTGWFGSESSPPSKGGVDAFRGRGGPEPNPLPSATPQLSKELIYAGSRLLAVEDANATQAPPADIAVWRPTTGGLVCDGADGFAGDELYMGHFV